MFLHGPFSPHASPLRSEGRRRSAAGARTSQTALRRALPRRLSLAEPTVRDALACRAAGQFPPILGELRARGWASTPGLALHCHGKRHSAGVPCPRWLLLKPPRSWLWSHSQLRVRRTPWRTGQIQPVPTGLLSTDRQTQPVASRCPGTRTLAGDVPAQGDGDQVLGL